jgi:serine/threonine protein kinase
MGSPLRRQEIFTQALATPPSKRPAFLDSVCGADQELRREVEHLLSTSQGGSATQQSSGKSPSSPRSKTVKIPSRLKQALSGTYVIQERIGGGGMGDLYLASHKTLGGKWAIKVLAEDFAQNPKVVERFVNEAKIEANLQHPNIIKVFHIGHSGTFHYLVMNYVEGEDLTERITRNGALPESEGVAIAVQICRALECAHDHNITHRDLKPSNIRIDGYGTVVVLDFGIARARDVAMTSLTNQGERLGTPLYMSPEQTRGAQADTRSDLYSLGVLLYEMFSGINPFEADSAHAVYARQLNFNPPPLSEAAPGISQDLSDIVMKLLEKDPGQRFQTVREVSARLRPLREITEVKGPIRTFPAYLPETMATADRMKHVVLRIPETQISRELSADESRVLELTDGNRTIAEILELSQLDPERLFTTLDGLKGERAIETAARPETEMHLPLAPDFFDRFLPFVPARYRKVGLWAAVGVLVAVVAILTYGRFSAPPAAATSIGFDASPFATVTVKTQKGRAVYSAVTPFHYPLAPGTYAIEFRYKDKTSQKNLTVEPGKPTAVRESFWSDKDMERLMNYFR